MAIPVDGVILKEEDLNRMFPPEETVILATDLDLLNYLRSKSLAT